MSRGAGRQVQRHLHGLGTLVLTLSFIGLSSVQECQAQTPLIQSGSFTLRATGYIRSLTGVHDTRYDLPTGNRRSGFHADVARVKWRAGWGERFVLEIHNRAQVQVSSSESGFGSSVAGFGVSAAPGHLVDLESVWIQQERLRAWHDVDRLALTFYTPATDVTVGRQAITWGTSLIFPVADLWSQFSPFELDTEEKPGVDAIRMLAYPLPGLELDAVVADRGGQDDVSAGVRATWSLSSADLYGAAGRLWEEAMVVGGVAWLLESWKLRAEAVLPRDLDLHRWLDPRATIGVDRLGYRLTLSGEYHFNGLGANGPNGYLSLLGSESFNRGESYFLGRHYLGGLASWATDEEQRIRLLGSVLVNLSDGSVALLPALTWDVGASTSLALGGLVGIGDRPVFQGELPVLGSEYGTYGDLGHVQVSVYF